MFNDSREGTTNFCNHPNNNTSGICDKCLGKEHKENWVEELSKTKLDASTESDVQFFIREIKRLWKEEAIRRIEKVYVKESKAISAETNYILSVFLDEVYKEINIL